MEGVKEIMENKELIKIGDTVKHDVHGIGKVVGFDGTNLVDFNGRIQSVFDHELTKEEIDLFDHYETLPEEVQAVLDRYCTGDNSYPNCANLVLELEAIGYTCDYGLDAEPHNLRKLTREVITNPPSFITGAQYMPRRNGTDRTITGD